MGMAKWDHIKTLLADPVVGAAWIARHGKPATDADVDAIYSRFLPLQEKVVADHSDVIPGVADTVRALRERGLRIGATTGYPRSVTDVVQTVAAAQGYAPDMTVAAGETPSGRPGPAMALKCVIELDVSPVEACVKVGDTVVDIGEGLSAGMWSIGVTDTGNGVGLPPAEWSALSFAERAARSAAAAAPLLKAGAHYVIPSLVELPRVLDAIEARLARGERP